MSGLPPILADILGTHPAMAPHALYAEMVEAHLCAARAVLGDDAPLEGRWDDERGVELSLVLVARDPIRHPSREVPRAPLLRHGGPFVGLADGEALVFGLPNQTYSVDHTEEIRALLGDAFRFRFEPEALKAACRAEMSRLVRRYVPSHHFAPGSLGALLERGGEWMIGCEGAAAPGRLRIEAVILRAEVEGMQRETTTFGLRLARRDGDDDGERFEATESVASSLLPAYLDAQVSEGQLPALREALSALARSSPHHATAALLGAVLRPPQPGSLAEWAMHLELGAPLRAEIDGQWLEVSATYHAPRVAFGTPLEAVAELRIASGERMSRGRASDVSPCWVSLGVLSADAVDRAAPRSEAERAHAGLLVHGWRLELEALLAHVLRAGDARDVAFQIERALWLRPLTMLDFALRHGLPGPMPPALPPLEDHPLSTASEGEETEVRRRLERARAITSAQRLLAVLRIGDAWIALGDSRLGHPFSEAAIWLLAEDEVVTVLGCDDYHRYARHVVDGDTHALRRFLGWLRASIETLGLARVDFIGREIADELEDIEEEYEAPIDESPSSLSVLAWLGFGAPAPTSVLDHRCQAYLAQPGIREDLTPSYRFRVEHVEIPRWRRFLAMHVDAALADR